MPLSSRRLLAILVAILVGVALLFTPHLGAKRDHSVPGSTRHRHRRLPLTCFDEQSART